jgi:hypothetical protein
MHGVDIENMITSAAKRIRLNECAELATRPSLIWMRFGTSDHILVFNIHDVQLIIIFVSLCGVNKEVKENNNNNKNPNPILAFYIQTREAQTTI